MKRCAVAASLAVALIACDSGEEQTFTVEGHLAPCTGLAVRPCMVVDDGLFYDSIDGFGFAWGFRSQINVEVTEVENPPIDGSSLEYTLIDVLDETVVAPGETYELGLLPIYATPDAGGFVLPDERRIECPGDGQLCVDMEARLAGTEGFYATVAHPADPTDPALPLELVALRDFD